MDVKDIEFKTDHGRFIIHPEGFYPCDKQRFIKLFKLMYADFDSRDKNIRILKEFFADSIVECDEKAKAAARTYFQYRQECSDLQRCIESGRWSNGVKMKKDEVKDARESIKRFKKIWKTAEVDAKKNKRMKEQFSSHIELLNSLLEGAK